jgi:hypothetical protein
MTASLTTAEPFPAIATADQAGRALLLANGAILGFIALAAAMADLAGHFVNLGPMGPSLYQNNDAIGFFEAHGLALLVAVLLLRNSNAVGPSWNFTAATLHLLLGGANLLFWPVFVENGLVPMGVATTAMHAVFFVLELGVGLWRKPDIITGPGGLFRVAAAITIFTGVSLHISRLPLGPELFQQTVLTPLADSLFAVPMTIAGVAGALLWRRAILPVLWQKLVYGFVVIFFLGSIVIHAKTIVTWDTSYLNAFPAWYPVLAAVYLSAIGIFAVTRHFHPRTK